MTNLKDKKALCIDYGSYFPLAQRLARDDGFGVVYYFCPIVHNGFPTHKPVDIGRNVPNVIKVSEWASVINEVDIVIFPDVFEPELQLFFQRMGKAVFGSKHACELEYDRKQLKDKISELGLPLNKYYVANGIDELEAILKKHEDVYIKAGLRGDCETWHSQNYNLSKGEIHRMRSHLGAYQNQETYIVEEPIKSIAEIGIDTFCINGEYPAEVLTGVELKDTGYYGQVVPYKTLPKQLKLVTEEFKETFKELNYTGAHSNEVMVGENKKGYLIDLTQRMPQPPSDLMMEMFTNFPQIIWDVANGIVPKIEYKYNHGVQFIIKSEIAKTDACPIIVPEEYKNNVKIKNLTIDDDGTWYYTPLGEVEMCEIGSVVFCGNSMKECVKGAKKIAESIKGFDIKINTDCIGKAQEQIDKLKAAGINYLQ